MPIENYLCLISVETQNQVLPLIKYIENNFPQAVFDEKYSDKSHIPTWRLNNSFVGIGCRKHYISIYFGKEKAATIVAQNTPYCRCQKSCVNLSYRRAIPYEAVFKGIDASFSL